MVCLCRSDFQFQEFRDCNKKDLLDKIGHDVFDSIRSGEAVNDPSLLSKFVLLTFADLKTYKFMYWLGVPAVLPETPFTYSSFQNLQDVNGKLTVSLYRALLTCNLNEVQSVFAFKDGVLISLSDAWPSRNDPSMYFVVPDASSAAESFGWTVRNFLALLSVHSTEASSVNIIGLRGTFARKLFRYDSAMYISELTKRLDSEKDFSASSLTMYQSLTESELRKLNGSHQIVIYYANQSSVSRSQRACYCRN